MHVEYSFTLLNINFTKIANGLILVLDVKYPTLINKQQHYTFVTWKTDKFEYIYVCVCTHMYTHINTHINTHTHFSNVGSTKIAYLIMVFDVEYSTFYFKNISFW